MKNTINFDKFPPLIEMIEKLIPILLLVHDKYCKRRVSRIATRQSHTMFDYVYVCIYYHMFITKSIYSMDQDEEAKCKKQRHALRLDLVYELGDFTKSRELGIDKLCYKGELITDDIEHEDMIRLMTSLYISIENIRKIIIKDIGERYELKRKA